MESCVWKQQKAEGTEWHLVTELRGLSRDHLAGSPGSEVGSSELVPPSPIASLWATTPPEGARDPGPAPGPQGLRETQVGETCR